MHALARLRMLTCQVALLAASMAAAAQEPPVELPLWQRLIDTLPQGYDMPSLAVHPSARVSWVESGDWYEQVFLATHDPAGNRLGYFELCDECYLIEAADDGTAWLGQYHPYPAPSWDYGWRIHRYSPQGELLTSVDLTEHTGYSGPRLFPDGDEVDVLMLPNGAASSVALLRVDAAGNPGPIRAIPIYPHPVYAGVDLTEFRRHPDGRISLVLELDARRICAPLLPCGGRAYMVLWLNAQREPMAVHAFGTAEFQDVGARLDEHGRLWRLDRSNWAAPGLQIVERDGTPGPITPLDPPVIAFGVEMVGVVGEHLLLRTASGLWLYDAKGRLSQHVAIQAFALPYGESARSAHGFLMRAAIDEDVSLFDPESLAIGSHFDLDPHSGPAYGAGVARGKWRVLPEGWIHAAVTDASGNRLAVFAIPGTPAYRPFGSGFEAEP